MLYIEIDEKIKDLTKRIENLEKILGRNKNTLNCLKTELFEQQQIRTLILEIYRLAEWHLPRLQRNSTLTANDHQEIHKWISRTKSLDGLNQIIKAFKSLDRFHPGDIKKNLYALIQKIIIEGPN